MEEVIDVGSSNIVDEAASGPLCAPGEHIMVALPNDGYDFRSGSSLAAAHVSGVIALLLTVMPNADSTNVEKVLRRSQLALNGGQMSVNACKALQIADSSISCDS